MTGDREGHEQGPVLTLDDNDSVLCIVLIRTRKIRRKESSNLPFVSSIHSNAHRDNASSQA